MEPLGPPSPTPEGESEHLAQLEALLALEAAEAAARVQARRDRLSPEDAESAGTSLVQLALVDEFPSLGGLQVVKLVKRNRSERLPWTRIDVGSPVLLGPHDDTEASLRGVVSSLKSDAICVALSGEFADLDPDATYRVDLSGDEVTTQRQQAALRRARAAHSDRAAHLRGVFSGRLPAAFDDEVPVIDPDLDESQRRAVTCALAAEDVALVHGPPGTGKTRTLVEIITRAVARGETVLATAPSNLAVDNMLERLVARNVPVVRLGHPARVLSELVTHTLSVRVAESDDVQLAKRLVREAFDLRRKADRRTRTRMDRRERNALRFEAKSLLKDARRLERQARARILDAAAVICATTSVDPDLLKDRRFDLVAFDEAGQSTEPGSWPPTLVAERIVFAGDHLQLPPTVVSPEAAAAGFSTSLFERLMHSKLDPRAKSQLTLQYRMHADIMGFSNQALYEGTLEADASVRAHLLSDLPGVGSDPVTETPLELVDTAGAGWSEEVEPDGESRRNPAEAEHLQRTYLRLRELGVEARQIGIITPYAAQARLLRSLIPDDGVEIDTVDGFQGREKEAILISLVRSNDEGEVGFLADVRRMNVALTRARRRLVVVGDGATLAAHAFYRELFEWFEARGAYRTVWEL